MSGLQGIPPKVFLSPFVLSTVMLDNSNCAGDQEGFLIGKSHKSLRCEINDQSLCNTEEDLMISVYSAYPCGKFLAFYNSHGVLNVDFIRNFLGDRMQSVVGWYRFRRNIPPYPSAREVIVHRNLMKLFSGNIAIGDHFFMCGVFGSSISESGGTHTYDYAFYIDRTERFMPLGLSMLNLIDTNTKYRSGSLASSFVNSKTFDSVLNIPWSFESSWQTEDGIQQMLNVLRDKCSNLAEELTASESVNATIEDEVAKLEEELELLTVKDKQALEWQDPSDSNDDLENTENILPEQEARNMKKRYWAMEDTVDFETENMHPVYGKYFKQNRTQHLSQIPSEASESGCYILPPPKKFKVLQEHKRVIDHDYSSASDEDSHKFVQDSVDDKADDFDGSSLPSNEGYISPDEVDRSVYGKTEIWSQVQNMKDNKADDLDASSLPSTDSPDDCKSSQETEVDTSNSPSDASTFVKGVQSQVMKVVCLNNDNQMKVCESPKDGSERVQMNFTETQISLVKRNVSYAPVTAISQDLFEHTGDVYEEVVLSNQQMSPKAGSDGHEAVLANLKMSPKDESDVKEKFAVHHTDSTGKNESNVAQGHIMQQTISTDVVDNQTESKKGVDLETSYSGST